MKIAVIGYLDFYGSMGKWVLDGWKALGHEVVGFDRKSELPTKGFDVYFYVDCSEDFSAGMKEVDGIRVFWSLDAHMPGGIERSVNIGRTCELVFSSNYEHGVQLLRKFGIESVLMPITYNDLQFSYFNFLGARKYDVGMVGNPNSPQRQQLWNGLSKYKAKVGRMEAQEDFVDCLTEAKIIVNQPTEPWDNILNNRFFEAMAFGAVLLQKRLSTNLIEKLGFKENEHFIYWSELDELYMHIEHILKTIENGSYERYSKMVEDSNRLVEKYSLINQLRKIEAIILSTYYERL